MKYLLILFLFLFIDGYAQIEAPTELHSAMSSIHDRGLAHGVDIYSKLETTKRRGYVVVLKNVVLTDTLPSNIIGRVNWYTAWSYKHNWYYNPTIYISTELLDEPYLLEVVLAHELGHVMGLTHSCLACEDIMSGLQIANKNTLEYQHIYNPQYLDFRWEAYYNRLRNECK